MPSGMVSRSGIEVVTAGLFCTRISSTTQHHVSRRIGLITARIPDHCVYPDSHPLEPTMFFRGEFIFVMLIAKNTNGCYSPPTVGPISNFCPGSSLSKLPLPFPSRDWNSAPQMCWPGAGEMKTSTRVEETIYRQFRGTTRLFKLFMFFWYEIIS